MKIEKLNQSKLSLKKYDNWLEKKIKINKKMIDIIYILYDLLHIINLNSFF